MTETPTRSAAARRLSQRYTPDRDTATMRDLVQTFRAMSRVARSIAALAVIGAGALGAKGAVEMGAPEPAGPVTRAEFTSLRYRVEDAAFLTGFLASRECGKMDRQQVVDSRVPCDSLLRNVGGYQALRVVAPRVAGGGHP